VQSHLSERFGRTKKDVKAIAVIGVLCDMRFPRNC
jgi:hypothetical protein